MHQRMQRLFKKNTIHATYVSYNIPFSTFSSCNLCVSKRSLRYLLFMQRMCPKTFASLPSLDATYVSENVRFAAFFSCNLCVLKRSLDFLTAETDAYTWKTMGTTTTTTIETKCALAANVVR